MADDPAFRTAVSDRITVDVHLQPHREQDEIAELREALDRTPRQIPTRYFYDEYGSRLFDQICDLPEYYQTRTERKILSAISDEIVRLTGVEEVLELGSGMATKTRVILDAMNRAGRLRRYLPFDVSEAIVHEVARELIGEYPHLEVHAIVGDFTNHLPHLPGAEKRLVIFLGGTIGNFHPTHASGFLREVADNMNVDDFLLLGTDLIKDPARIEAAYNDSRGVTAEFNRNVLRVVNRSFGASFEPERFRHRAFYDRENAWIEMRLVSDRKQTVWINRLDRTYYLAADEEIRTELSVKYDRSRVEALLGSAGFDLVDWFTDEDNLFALSLARRARS